MSVLRLLIINNFEVAIDNMHISPTKLVTKFILHQTQMRSIVLQYPVYKYHELQMYKMNMFFYSDLMKEIDNLSEDYVSGVRGMDSGERTDHLKKIEIAFSKSKEYVDDKVQLAMQTYEMVNTIQLLLCYSVRAQNNGQSYNNNMSDI